MSGGVLLLIWVWGMCYIWTLPNEKSNTDCESNNTCIKDRRFLP